jgi:hypothetical protein
MEKWLEFRVENEECKHEQDQYNGCPLCEIDELVDMLEEMLYSNSTKYRGKAEALIHKHRGK